jgi:putative membrane protein
MNEQDHQRIQAAVTAAEAKTYARFAAVVVPASDRYGSYPLIWAAMLALAVGAALALFLPDLPVRQAILIEAGVLAVFALAFDWFVLRLLLVPGHVKREHASALAHREFGARILSPSDRREGLLFFVSPGERYVELLATHDVHQAVGEAVWNGIVADFTDAAKAGRVADGIVAGIETCAGHLKTHFPKAG